MFSVHLKRNKVKLQFQVHNITEIPPVDAFYRHPPHHHLIALPRTMPIAPTASLEKAWAYYANPSGAPIVLDRAAPGVSQRTPPGPNADSRRASPDPQAIRPRSPYESDEAHDPYY